MTHKKQMPSMKKQHRKIIVNRENLKKDGEEEIAEVRNDLENLEKKIPNSKRSFCVLRKQNQMRKQWLETECKR